MSLFSFGSVFKRIYTKKHFDSVEDIQEFQLRLQDELNKGTIQRIPVSKLCSHINPEEWYEEKGSGKVYRLVIPEFPFKGLWEQVKDLGERSFFERLYPGDRPSEEEFELLQSKLTKLWKEGEIEKAIDSGGDFTEIFVYHHRPTDETFELYPPFEPFNTGIWQKTFRSHKTGSWPDELTIKFP